MRETSQDRTRIQNIDGGMAFPCEWHLISDDLGFEMGLSKLEYVAAQVLKGMYSNPAYGDRTPNQLAEMAFEQAGNFLMKYKEITETD